MGTSSVVRLGDSPVRARRSRWRGVVLRHFRPRRPPGGIAFAVPEASRVAGGGMQQGGAEASGDPTEAATRGRGGGVASPRQPARSAAVAIARRPPTRVRWGVVIASSRGWTSMRREPPPRGSYAPTVVPSSCAAIASSRPTAAAASGPIRPRARMASIRPVVASAGREIGLVAFERQVIVVEVARQRPRQQRDGPAGMTPRGAGGPRRGRERVRHGAMGEPVEDGRHRRLGDADLAERRQHEAAEADDLGLVPVGVERRSFGEGPDDGVGGLRTPGPTALSASR